MAGSASKAGGRAAGEAGREAAGDAKERAGAGATAAAAEGGVGVGAGAPFVHGLGNEGFWDRGGLAKAAPWGWEGEGVAGVAADGGAGVGTRADAAAKGACAGSIGAGPKPCTAGCEAAMICGANGARGTGS